MVRKTCDVAIVGSGFSGLVAANVLADRGLRVLLLDENIRMGGQVLRTLPWSRDASGAVGLRRHGFRLMDGMKREPIEVLNRTKVLDIDEELGLLAEEEERGIISVAPGMLLLATGARERFLPFKGWTLPGVISTGAAQILMKGYGVLPARRMLVSGTGPFLLALSAEFLRNHGKLLSILDMGGLREKLLLLTQGFYHFSKFMEGARYLSAILTAHVPFHHRTAVIEARGRGELDTVVAAKVSSSGSIMRGTERIYRTGCLAVGWGYTPNIELPQRAGCALTYNNTMGGWVVRVGDDLETTVDRVFAAGEITGIAGALKSINEGELAAYGILRKLGRDVDLRRLRLLERQRSRHLRSGVCFNKIHKLPDQAFQAIPDEVTICRCEDVKMGDIRRAVNEGYDTPAVLKRALRIGMGNCQGRTCAPLVYDILSSLTKRTAKDIPVLSVRSPVKAVAVRSFEMTPGLTQASTGLCGRDEGS
jgi:D-hydroxyproline dehydrogenase subunit alpha